ncbi:hypothetical protein P875_00075827 [Aspergillus parasiticus SU-1]|uniref:Uncharacterized protein n=1 Tax=Aspergillus parasiticus (strain ATCC 56775 / NRRL 5862 / SRRC 143 / SU-1) TaxID=1403190 RepID=A0A0F0ILG9_ASPPU|nr:hypothetical protein P875_00075827 [Aspergillus parasiticus SU-1]
MPATLPLELLFEIASILHLAGDCLVPYTTVCRRWQAAFEPFIYSNLIVYSDNAYKEEDQKGISLAHFQKATTGSGSFRRAWIKRLQYDILVPFELLDWTTHKKEGYSVDNPVREANDQAFQTAITGLFETLSSWNQSHRLSLELGLLGCQIGEEPEPEPYTWYFPVAGEYRYDYRNGREMSVPPYRARLHNNDASVLAYAPCVDKLFFMNESSGGESNLRHRFHQIWAGTVAQIVQHCPTITQLYINLNEWVRPDHIEYIRARRDGKSRSFPLPSSFRSPIYAIPYALCVSELFKSAPRSLKVLHYSNQYEEPWKDVLPALNVMSTETDTFTINLRVLSTVLQELKLYNTSLSSDFLWPLDKAEIDDVPPFLPSGKWLALPTPEEQARLDEPDDEISSPDDVIWDYDRGYARRQMVNNEEYNRFFTSMGHAARHMPRLKFIKFHLEHSTWLDFSFRTDSDPITAKWYSDATPAYHPDERVAEAWGFPIEDFHFDPEEFDTIVNFDCWPPEDV